MGSRLISRNRPKSYGRSPDPFYIYLSNEENFSTRLSLDTNLPTILTTKLSSQQLSALIPVSSTLESPPSVMVPKPPPGHFNVLYFASAGSFAAKEYESFLSPLPISKLFETLEEKHIGIKTKILDSALVTVNLNYVDLPDNADDPNQVVIQEGDEVAIIPPVSSG